MTAENKMNLIADLSKHYAENGIDVQQASGMMDLYAELVVDLLAMSKAYGEQNNGLIELVHQYEKENNELKQQLNKP